MNSLTNLRVSGSTKSTRHALLGALLVLASVTGACRPSEPLRIANLQLGRSLNPDNSVAAHTTRFKPDDTVYVSILSDDPGSGLVTVRWLLNGQVVSEAKRDVSYTRAAATEFHLQNSGGFPPGSYRVDILINGQQAGSREFRVEN
jgi:hypothetical protein